MTATPVPCLPTLTAVQPAVIMADRSTQLSLAGTDFKPLSTLQVSEAITLPANYISSTLLTALAPAGLSSGWYTATLLSDNGCVTTLPSAFRVEGPRLAALTINGGALSSTAVTVTLNVTPVGGGSAAKTVGVSFLSDTQTWTPWLAYTPTYTWTLTSGDGAKTVYARSKDSAGNVSPVISATIGLDTAALAYPGVAINQGLYFANQMTATLMLGAAAGTAQMQVSNDAGFAGAKWEPYLSRRAWVLSPTVDLADPSLVYVRYKNLRGSVSPVYQDDVILDTSAPTGTVKVAGIVSGTLAGESRSYSFDEYRYLRLAFGNPQKMGIALPAIPPTSTLTASLACPDCFTVDLDLPAMDDLSGVGAVRISTTPDFSGTDWEIYKVSQLWGMPAEGGAVYVQYRDLAGNMSAVYTATVPSPQAKTLPKLVPNHLGTERVVLADYMMWYGPDTFNGSMTWDIPAAGPYNSSDPATIRRQVADAQLACLDGFAAHWYGPTDMSTTNNFDMLLAASVGTSLRHSIVIQTNILPNVDEGMLVDAINYVTTHWAQHPNYLRLGGRPVLTFTDMPRPWNDPMKALAAWQRIRAATDPGHSMVWMAEGLYPAYNPIFDGLYIYRIDHRDFPEAWRQQPRWAQGLRDLEHDPKMRLPLGGLYFGDSIAPGFDNTRLANSPINFSDPAPVFARDRQNGAYYADTFAATALTGGDLLYVKSFNEWIEGTEIEPGATYGDRYLNLTCQYANAYRGR